jgi:alpha-beta hydrolase superfamily lysophospholipase
MVTQDQEHSPQDTPKTIGIDPLFRRRLSYMYQIEQSMQTMITLGHHQPLLRLNRSNYNPSPQQFLNMCTPASTTSQDTTRNDETNKAIDAFVENYAQLFKNAQRSPILRRPSEYDLPYEEIFFPSLDGTVLQGWYIPKPGSKKLIIANHPMTCNRYGLAGHLEGYGGFGGFEVNFLPDYKALNEAGYHVIAYDLRNHGISSQGSGGVCGALGYYEAREVVGSLNYARSREELRGASIGLLSRCLGGNSTIHAMSHFPQYFKDDVKAMILLQAVSGHAFVEKGAKNLNLDVPATLKAFDHRIHELTGFRLNELTPIPLTKDVKVPTLFVQVRKDSLIDTKDSQEIFDGLGSEEKKLVWIENTDRRFDGYNHLGKEPKEMLEWFGKHV